MSDKPIIIGIGDNGVSESIAKILAEKGLSLSDVIIIDPGKYKSKEELKNAIEEISGKPFVIEDLKSIEDLRDSKPKEKRFPKSPIKELKQFDVIDEKDDHPFSKFMKNKKKKW